MEDEKTREIIDYLEGKLTSGQKQSLLKWIYSTEENKEFYFKTKKVFDLLHQFPEIDPVNSWEKLYTRMDKATKYRLFVNWKSWLQYAAVLFFAVLSTSIYFSLKNSVSVQSEEWYTLNKSGGKESVILPDGTCVYIGSATTISYPKDYGKNHRRIHLQGEAYFDVVKQDNNPFIVQVDGQEIEVLGTKFNVMAYPDDSFFTTTLLEGSIRLTTPEIDSSTYLFPNQQLVYERANGEITVSEVDARLAILWIDGYYRFFDESLSSILQQMGRVYGKTFIIPDEQLRKTLYAGTFYKDQSVEDILGVINVTIPIQYRHAGDTIYIE